MIFIDRSVPKSVAEALKLVRNDDVRWLEDIYPHDIRDELWLPDAGAIGWLVVSRDKKIRSRSWQRELVRRHGVGCFIINQKRDLTRWEYLKLFANCLDEMVRRFVATPRPFMRLVSLTYALRDVPL